MFAFAHDNIYVADSGIFACNEVDIGLPLPPGMMSVIKKKHNDYKTLRDMCLYGKKFTSEEALKFGMIDGIFPIGTILKEIGEKAEKLSSYGANK
jgi:enoyl-CoA hydratase/carnithine racemase